MPEITDYESADTYLRAGRNHADRPAPTGAATRIQRRGSAIAVNYRGTDVVTFARDGSIAIDRGDMLTRTTADRIDTYSPMRVADGYQESGWTGKLVRHGSYAWTLTHPRGRREVLQDGGWFTPV